MPNRTVAAAVAFAALGPWARSAPAPKALQPAAPPPAGIAALQAEFSKPPRTMGPMPVWWWSGDDLDAKRLIWQMDRMVEARVTNAVVAHVAPTSGLYGSAADRPKFLSEEWWRIVAPVVKHARAVGMRLWFSDHLGFPSAGIQDRLLARRPECRARDLEVAESDAVGPADIEAGAEARPLALFALELPRKGAAPLLGCRIIDFSAAAAAGRGVRLPEGAWRVLTFTETPGGFDYLSPRASALLLETVQGAMERRLGPYLGSTVAGTCRADMASPNRWTAGFLEKFRKRKGYDLRSRLPLLLYDVRPTSGKLRCDVASVQAALLEEALLRPSSAWHSKHNMRLLNEPPVGFDNPIEAQSAFPEPLRALRWAAAQGSDDAASLKALSSAAHTRGRSGAWMLGPGAAGWSQTLEQSARAVEAAALRGATLFSPSGFLYATQAGWWEWSNPGGSFRQPSWRQHALFADHVARIAVMASGGSHRCDVALVYPSSAIMAAMDPLSGSLVAARSRQAAAVRDAFAATRKALDAAGLDYDVLDEATVAGGAASVGRLRVAGEAYRALLLPGLTTFSAAAASRLREHRLAGGTVATVGALPSEAAEVASKDSAMADALRTAFAPRGPGRALSGTTASTAVRALLDALGRHASPVGRTLHRAVADGDWFLVTGEPGGSETAWFRAEGRPEIWNPYTGRCLPARPVGTSKGAVGLRLSYAESPALVVVFRRDAAGPNAQPAAPLGPVRPAEAPDPAGSARQVRLAPEWSSALAQTADNRWGDFALPPTRGPLPVECRRFRYREERLGEDGVALGWHEPEAAPGEWGWVTAGFGQRWWISGEVPRRSDLPLPGPDNGVWTPSAPMWAPAAYSTRIGIEKDPVHHATFGPKGRVPDEYLDLGTGAEGATRYAVTFLHSPVETQATAWLGGNGRPELCVNGEWLAEGQTTVRLMAGYNAVALRLTQPAHSRLRAFLHLGPPGLSAWRPAWIWYPEAPLPGVLRTFRTTLNLDTVPDRVEALITADNSYALFVNGRPVGRDGGSSAAFWQSAETYAIRQYLHAGANVIAVRVHNLTGQAGLLAAIRAYDEHGTPKDLLTTGPAWRAGKDAPNGWNRAGFDDSYWPEAMVAGWYPCEPWGWIQGMEDLRGAVLPDSGWLNGRTAPWASAITVDPRPGLRKSVGWYRFDLPPGTTSVDLSLWGRYRVFIGGKECAPAENGIVTVPAEFIARGALCALRVQQPAGRYEGAVFEAPVRLTVAAGRMELGPWSAQGLASYSGGVQYQQTVELPSAAPDAALDLGAVQGVAEVSVNGRSAGVRLWPPYRFGLAGLLRKGTNRISVTIYNTAASWFGAGRPGPYATTEPDEAGWLGPASLLVGTQ